jgi:DNA-binding SARP family transcriptional activator
MAPKTPEPAQNRPSFTLFRDATLLMPDGPLVHIERKTAGLLAFLSLDGAVARVRLATLLWPRAKESAARNNLAQALRRLKGLCGDVAPVRGKDFLSLDEGVRTDLCKFMSDHKLGRFGDVAAVTGELLAGHDYDDCAEFAVWLATQQQRCAVLRREAFEHLAEEAEQAGDWRKAFGYAGQLLALDETDESATRCVMRLSYLLGDRSAALKTYEQCRRVLRKDLGVSPVPETEALADIIRKSAAEASAASRPGMPLSVLRPPRLIGRESVLVRMEEAWQRRQAIFIAGPPGIGKTRLLGDFLADKEQAYFFGGRPSDMGVAYASHSRSYGDMLKSFPDIVLPNWVRRELVRILPQLGDPRPPITAPDEKLRFLQAKAEATRLAVDAGMRIVVVDDLHFVDLDSLEAGHFVYAQHWGNPNGMRTIICYRSDELVDMATVALNQVVEAGAAIHIQLQPLGTDDVTSLVDSLDLGADFGVDAVELARYTGGNPFFVLETIKALFEARASGASPGGVPGTVKVLIRRRLDRLTSPAIELAHLAAVAGTRFDPGLASFVIGQPLLALADPWAELDAAQILDGNHFVHDLIRETVLGSVPAAIRDHLEGRIAAYPERKAGGKA